MKTNRGMGINLYEEVLESIKIVNDDDNGLELVQMEKIAEWVAARLQMKLDDVMSRKEEVLETIVTLETLNFNNIVVLVRCDIGMRLLDKVWDIKIDINSSYRVNITNLKTATDVRLAIENYVDSVLKHWFLLK